MGRGTFILTRDAFTVVSNTTLQIISTWVTLTKKQRHSLLTMSPKRSTKLRLNPSFLFFFFCRSRIENMHAAYFPCVCAIVADEQGFYANAWQDRILLLPKCRVSRKSRCVHDRSFIRLFPLEPIAISRLLFLYAMEELLQRLRLQYLLK